MQGACPGYGPNNPDLYDRLTRTSDRRAGKSSPTLPRAGLAQMHSRAMPLLEDRSSFLGFLLLARRVAPLDP